MKICSATVIIIVCTLGEVAGKDTLTLCMGVSIKMIHSLVDKLILFQIATVHISLVLNHLFEAYVW